MTTISKIDLKDNRVVLSVSKVDNLLKRIFISLGCSSKKASEISGHLIDASLCGVESHGVFRVLQYVEWYKKGYLSTSAKPELKKLSPNTFEIDGGGGLGIPVMNFAFKKAISNSKKNSISAVAIKNVGHTGRLGFYADYAAEKGLMTILISGGNRKEWSQVAPYGGIEGKLPTNPWCVGFPGGLNGPVVLDFATSKIAGGLIYAAKSAGGLLPEGCIIDKKGNLTRNPDHYFDGGAILPFGKHKGFGLSLIAQLIAESMLGKVKKEANWLLITIKTSIYNTDNQLKELATEILSDVINCKTASGFKNIQIPGELERENKKKSNNKIYLPKKTWDQILTILPNITKNKNPN